MSQRWLQRRECTGRISGTDVRTGPLAAHDQRSSSSQQLITQIDTTDTQEERHE
ncbi:MAG: hypothetical protein NZ578_12225 [Candidatus Binatia bacterium]|nr:hypothetical protein [Candidatus Binatia bacterium]